MKILLGMAAKYLLVSGGAQKNLRVLMEGLAQRGHICRVVAPGVSPSAPTHRQAYRAGLAALGIELRDGVGGVADVFRYNGVEVHATWEQVPLSDYLLRQIREFEPTWTLIAEDCTNLIEVAREADPSRMIHIIQSTVVLPYGPMSAQPNPIKAKWCRRVGGVITLSRYLQDYVRRWNERESEVIPFPVYGSPPFPNYGNLAQGYVTLINPCLVKGLPIFLDLARALPEVAFAAVPTWGTTSADRAALEALPNVTLLAACEEADSIYAQTRVLLVPSLWDEGFGMVAVEAMLRGIPVLASNTGGLPEAKLGVDYVLPLRPIEGYGDTPSDQVLAEPIIPPQDAEPWKAALREVLSNQTCYERVSEQSRAAALKFVETLSIERFENFFESLASKSNQIGRRDAQPPEDLLKARVLAARPSWSGTRVPGISGDPGRAGAAANREDAVGEHFQMVSKSVETDAAWDQVERMSVQRRALLARRLRKVGGEAEAKPAIPRAPRQGDSDSFPLSFAQQRFWFLDQLEPGSPFYNEHFTFRLRGALNVSAFQQALTRLVKRHEVLRTAFVMQTGRPRQIVSPPFEMPLPLDDLSTLAEPEREAEALRRTVEESNRPFNLSQPPLIRARLFRLSATEHILALVIHHIASDGWSGTLLARELPALYEAETTGQSSALPDLPIQYADYAWWQRETWAQGGNIESLLAYWKPQLAGASEVLEFPTDRPRPRVQTYQGTVRHFLLPVELAQAIRELSQREGATSFMVLLAAFNALLHRYTRQEDILVGSPIAGRNFKEVQGLIGCFLNTLVFRTQLDGDPTFRELVQRVRETALGAYAHQELPFEQLVDELHLARDMSRNPLFQVMFVFQVAPAFPYALPGFVMEFVDLPRGTTKFDFTLAISDIGDLMVGEIEYSTDLFDDATMARFVDHWQALLAGAVANPEGRLSTLPLLSEGERRQVLVEWNAPQPNGADRPTVAAQSPANSSNQRPQVETLSPGKLELLALWAKSDKPAATHIPSLPRNEGPWSFPLSFAQQRLWFLDQMEFGNPAYNAPAAVRLVGPLNVAALEHSLNEIVRRHEILRTTFAVEAGQPRQVVAPTFKLELPLVDLRDRPEAQREPAARELAVKDARQPFDLTRGPLLRAKLLRLADAEHWVLLTMHHIICDGWSAEVFVREMVALYSAFADGQSPAPRANRAGSPLSELPIQYADFAHWQQEWLRGEASQKHLAYWREQLAELPTLELPTDRPRPSVQSFQGALHPFTIPARVGEQLKVINAREGVTSFMTLLAVFQALLSRATGQEDIVVGTTIANRTRAELEGLIGFFANTLVLRTRFERLTPDPSFCDLLRQVREVTVNAYAHQDLPFERLVDELRPQRDLSRTPLFQVMFVWQHLPTQGTNFSGLAATPLPVTIGTAKFDLSLHVRETPEGLSGFFEYNTDLFDSDIIARLAERFLALLDSAVADPDQKLEAWLALSPAERRALLQQWNPSPAEYPAERCLPELFEAQVERTPNAIAVVFEDQRLTYAELNARANQLAQPLRALGVGPEVLVGVCLERSLEMVVSLLAILKAGGAYVPLDPTYPKARLAFMVADARIEVLITESRWLAGGGSWSLVTDNQPPPPASHQLPVTICLDTDWPTITTSGQPPATSHQLPTPDSLAYVIYTSGSTGQPKGSLVTHANITRLFDATQAWYNFTAADVWTFFHSYAFDFSVWEMWGALLYGGRLVIVPHWVSRSPEDFYNLLVAEQVTVLNQTPSAFRQLSQAEESLGANPELCLRLIIFGGEALELSSLRSWFERHGAAQPQLVNMYGITETTVHVTYRPVTVSDLSAGSVIGVPLPDLQIYVLDHQLNPVPPGVTGELYVGGAGLARGYLGRPDLTAERFVPNPFVTTDDGGRWTVDGNSTSVVRRPSREAVLRLYKTGDLVRYLSKGDIEYLGRSDQQVKLRGFRIELGEIEALLNQHPQVRETVVVAVKRIWEDRGATSEEKALTAYVVLRDGMAAPAELRSYLQAKLPEYMLPSAFVFLEALPLTPSGKLDRRALPAPEWGRLVASETYLAPRTPVEEVLAGMWAALLGLERVGVQDNFFEIGGHSLLATQAISRVREALGVNLPLRALFEAPTIARLAERVEAARRAEQPFPEIPLQPRPRDAVAIGPSPLSFAQQRLWLFDQLEPGSPAYNIPIAVRLQGPLAVSVLERSLNEIIRRHAALRTIFVTQAGRPTQVILPTLTLSLAALNPREHIEREAEVQHQVLAEAQRPFDLAHGPLLRARLWPLSETEHILLLTLPHIIFDGWSMGVLLQELAALYEAYEQGKESPLAALPIQYADFAHWQRETLQGETLERHLSYWRNQLANAPALELTTDHARPATQSYRGATYGFNVSQPLTRRLRALSDQSGVTLFMTLLAAFQALLARHTGQDDIVVGSPIANRTRAELERLLGFFVNTLVLRTDLSGDPSFRELLRRVREVALEAYAHQEVPFEQLVEALGVGRDLSRTPLFQVLLVFQNAPLPALEFGGLTVSPVYVDNQTSKFDLSLYLTETPDGLSAAMEYSTDLFDHATIVRLAEHFQTLLAGVAADPDQRLSALPLLTESEAQLLTQWNATTRRDFAALPAAPGTPSWRATARAGDEDAPAAPALEVGATDFDHDPRLSYRRGERERPMSANSQDQPKSSKLQRIAGELHDPEHIQQQLPAPSSPRPEKPTAFVAPRTPTEEKIAEIWAHGLGLEQVGINDDFFELGGDSLLATQLLARLSQALGQEVPIDLIFTGAFTVAGLAKAIAQHQVEQGDPQEVEALLSQLRQLSDDEARALLAEKKE